MNRSKRKSIKELTPAGQTGRRSRQRGSTGERELAARLGELTGLVWRRGLLQSRFGGRETADVVSEAMPAVHIECKRRKRNLNLVPGMKQAVEDAASKGQVPIVMGRADNAEWVVLIRLDDLLKVADLFAGLPAKKKVPPPLRRG